MTEFDCPEESLCGWQDVKIQLLNNLLGPSPLSTPNFQKVLLWETFSFWSGYPASVSFHLHSQINQSYSLRTTFVEKPKSKSHAKLVAFPFLFFLSKQTLKYRDICTQCMHINIFTLSLLHRKWKECVSLPVWKSKRVRRAIYGCVVSEIKDVTGPHRFVSPRAEHERNKRVISALISSLPTK